MRWPVVRRGKRGGRRGAATHAEGHSCVAGKRGAAHGRRAPQADLERDKPQRMPVNQSTKCLLPVAFHGGILGISTCRTCMSRLQNREKPTEWRRNSMEHWRSYMGAIAGHAPPCLRHLLKPSLSLHCKSLWVSWVRCDRPGPRSAAAMVSHACPYIATV